MDIRKTIVRFGGQVRLSRHAGVRAWQRAVHYDLIESTLQGGKATLFGKRHVRFRKEFRRGTLTCIGIFEDEKIVVKTVEWRDRT